MSVAELPLALARSRRERDNVLAVGSLHSKTYSVEPLLYWLGALMLYILLCQVHMNSEKFGWSSNSYANYGFLIFGSAFPFSLRSSLTAPRSKLLNLFLDIFDTVSPVAFLMSFFQVRRGEEKARSQRNSSFATDISSSAARFVRRAANTAVAFSSQLVVSIIGLFYPFMNTFLLLDAGNMSKSLQLCFKAILIPFKQLCLTIMFFVIVIAVYSSVAFEMFGIAGYKDGTGNHLDCDSFFDCFVLTTYITFRHSDIAEILDFPSAAAEDYGRRILFDLTFFIICGMFLFNMIGGLILDTFTHIRDERENRSSIYRSECFVSGLQRNTIEEDPRYRFVSFSKLNDESQNLWKYLYFIIYLKNKDSDEYTGVESYVSKCLAEESLKWLPNKVCCDQVYPDKEDLVGGSKHGGGMGIVLDALLKKLDKARDDGKQGEEKKGVDETQTS